VTEQDVNVSARTEYACLAVIELARRHGAGEPVRIRQIADEHGIPARFLVQILLQLKGAGLVTSTRGASGGYQLAKEPQEISLGEVMGVVDGRAEEITSSVGVETAVSLTLLDIWRGLARQQQKALQGISLADILERAYGSDRDMYYI
jgi:Rrf2 family protein